jgi:copper chaperone CopZ
MDTLHFSVPDMDCGGCVHAITEAVHRLDAAASVAADLTSKRVSVTTGAVAAKVQAAIEGAGFEVAGA